MSGIVAQNVGRRSGLIKTVAAGGEWTLISTQTASASATISFTSGLDSTYDEYCFKFINIHAEDNSAQINMNFSIDGGSNYNVAKTTTTFRVTHGEDDGSVAFAYHDSFDLAQGTGAQRITNSVDGSNNADSNASGYLYLFAPGDTTFVKHFITQLSSEDGAISYSQNTAGYGNTTSAVDAIQFAFTSGNIDAGTISLYGIG